VTFRWMVVLFQPATERFGRLIAVHLQTHEIAPEPWAQGGKKHKLCGPETAFCCDERLELRQDEIEFVRNDLECGERYRTRLGAASDCGCLHIDCLRTIGLSQLPLLLRSRN